MRTFLSEFKNSNAKHTRVATVAAETDADVATVQTVFSELSNEGVLQAKIEVRCPHCNTHHGTYVRQSAIPNEQHRCFVCDGEFAMDDQSNWGVIYKIIDDSADFFPTGDWHLQRYLDSEKDCPPAFFSDELDRLRKMDDQPQKRGRQFDHFIGLLFHQLEGTTVSVKESTKTGEVDVYVSCRQAPDWLTRLVGNGTILENKWQQDPVEKKEVDNFHSKAQDLAFPCYIAYFISMSGFSTGNPGALATLRSCEDPRIVDIDEEDVKEMVREGNPAKKLEERELL